MMNIMVWLGILLIIRACLRNVAAMLVIIETTNAINYTKRINEKFTSSRVSIRMLLTVVIS